MSMRLLQPLTQKGRLLSENHNAWPIPSVNGFCGSSGYTDSLPARHWQFILAQVPLVAGQRLRQTRRRDKGRVVLRTQQLDFFERGISSGLGDLTATQRNRGGVPVRPAPTRRSRLARGG